MANLPETKNAAAAVPLATIGQSSPVFTMLGAAGGADTPDGAVCGIDGVCVVPGETASGELSTTDSGH